MKRFEDYIDDTLRSQHIPSADGRGPRRVQEGFPRYLDLSVVNVKCFVLFLENAAHSRVVQDILHSTGYLSQAWLACNKSPPNVQPKLEH